MQKSLEKTVKLYEEDAYNKEFEAVVMSCEKDKDRYLVSLDRTAFYPEGGGQPADTGYIAGIRVTDTQEKDGIIYHYTEIHLNRHKCAVFNRLEAQVLEYATAQRGTHPFWNHCPTEWL